MRTPLAVFVLLLVYSALVGACESRGQHAEEAERRPAAVDTLDAAMRALVEEKRGEGLAPNRLIYEKSPYLLQHAFNPVDWYPWGDEAFGRARREDRPIFLSVGYSTCYWCHVMEREVFENDSLAALMNRYVVSIKVDREERPDVDRVYMTALQAMSGGGGWPMSLLLTPDLKPFFGATYIPPSSEEGRPGFGQVIRRVHEVWTQQRDQVQAQADQMAVYLEQVSAPQTEPAQVGREALDDALAWYETHFDAAYGGFGPAPRFPRPADLLFLLGYYERTGRQEALDMALATLRQMAAGGIYDHLGGGFHRYATDARWRVPHFEKMLYDQAQLAGAYLHAYRITRDPRYADVAREVLAYVDRVMRHPQGGFYSAEDAESARDPEHPGEKEEGAFYLWTKAEVERLLAPRAASVFAYVYGVEAEGNALQDPQQVFAGSNILYRAHAIEEAAAHFRLLPAEVDAILEEARAALFSAREQRPKPHLDDKILLSWNGLMISAYADAYALLGEASYRGVAETAASFLLEQLYDPATGTLKRRYRDGEARYDAGLADYAFFAQGLIDLYQATHGQRWLAAAIRLTDDQIARFYDDANGGFFDTTGEDASILIRSKEYYDGAEPSGNAVALLNLLRLAALTDNAAYRQQVEQSLAYFGPYLQRNPSAMPRMLVALDRALP